MNLERTKLTYVVNEKTKTITIVFPVRGLALQFTAEELNSLIKDLKPVRANAMRKIREIEALERKLMKEKEKALKKTIKNS